MRNKPIFLLGLLAAAGIASAQTSPQYAPGELIVKFPDMAPSSSALSNQLYGAKMVQTLGSPDIQRVKLPAGTSMSAAIAYYKAMGAKYAEPNYRMQAAMTPNDRYYSSQYGLPQIKCPSSWDLTLGSSSVVIAIIDTGVDLNHPDLAAKIVPGVNLVNSNKTPDDDNGHGTHCAGIAAAITNNGIGVAGVAPNCKIMPVKVLDGSGSGYLSTVAQGIRYAANGGAKVISLSLGNSTQSQTLQDAVTYAIGKGAVVVAAAGNDGVSSKFYPAACSGVIAVAAVDSNDNKASFSNYGAWVSVAAPGVRVYSTWMGDSYATASGTSMAAPYVAGEAAMLFSFFGSSTSPDVIKEKIEANNDPIGNWVANGRINLLAALTGPDNGSDNPTAGDITPSSLVFTKGSVFQGDVSMLGNSDDVRLVLQSSGSPMRYIDMYGVFKVGPAASVGTINLSLEGFTNTPGAVTVYAYQFSKKRWVQIGYASFSASDRSFYGPLNLNWTQYVNSSGEMRIRLYRSYRSPSPMTVSLDMFKLSEVTNK